MIKSRSSVHSLNILHFYGFSFGSFFFVDSTDFEYSEDDLLVSLRIWKCRSGMRWQTPPVFEGLCLYSSAHKSLLVNYSAQMASGWTGIVLCDMQNLFCIWFNLLIPLFQSTAVYFDLPNKQRVSLINGSGNDIGLSFLFKLLN